MNRRVISILGVSLAIVAGLTLATGCKKSEDTPTEPTKEDETPISTEFVGAIDSFGFSLLAQQDMTTNKNVIVSPVSVHDALSMTANGADGETAMQMGDVLGTSALDVDANQQWANLIAHLEKPGDEPTRKLDLANSIWYQDGMELDSAFEQTNKDYFGAKVASLDFSKSDAVDTINGWVSDNTNGEIKKIIDDLPGGAIMTLANAVYFEDDWISPFNPDSTSNLPFTRNDASTVDVPMMQSSSNIPFYESADYKATKLEYKDGETAFYIVLPTQTLPSIILENLANGEFATVRSELNKDDGLKPVNLALPKIDTEYSTDLTPSLKAMGMDQAFDANKADFSKMFSSKESVFIGSVSHATRLKVDEEGTTAAAATAVNMATTGLQTEEPQEFRCDRPFICALVDEKTGALLFTGLIVDPSAK